MKSGARILIVYGSETNVTKNFVKEVMVPHLQDHNGDSGSGDKKLQVEFVMGDTMAQRFEDLTHDNYDYLIVATSSFAEGDPPTGFGRFLYQLQETSKQPAAGTTDGPQDDDPTTPNNARRPFYGLQHAVVGIGNTQYDTFQNIPRHVDRYLSLCGSRRCKERLEWDEMENTEHDIQVWTEEMLQIISQQQKTKKTDEDKYQPDVCTWETPNNTIYEKHVGEDGWEQPVGGQNQLGLNPVMLMVGLLILIIAGAVYSK